MRALQTVLNLAYIITLFAAGMETTGFLSAACITLAILNIVAFCFMTVTWVILDSKKKSDPTVQLLKLAAALDKASKKR